MPIHLTKATRRQFLGAVGAATVLSTAPALGRETSRDESLVYLLNDTHIGEKHAADAPVPSHLRQVVDELVELERPPAGVLINGDLALRDGQPGDYRHFTQLIEPLREAGIDVHLTLGNHDHRTTFYDVLQEQSSHAALASRHAAVVETRHANFFLLDSLTRTMVTAGTLGARQLAWLASALDERADKPAVIVAHHNPRLGGDSKHFPGGLVDSPELWRLFTQRRQVKAYVHGHIHHRALAEHEGIHIINTPATSYVANPDTSTTGWTTARFDARGVTLTTHTNDAAHAWNGAVDRLDWRT